jgi:hypothetical protein
MVFRMELAVRTRKFHSGFACEYMRGDYASLVGSWRGLVRSFQGSTPQTMLPQTYIVWGKGKAAGFRSGGFAVSDKRTANPQPYHPGSREPRSAFGFVRLAMIVLFGWCSSLTSPTRPDFPTFHECHSASRSASREASWLISLSTSARASSLVITTAL